MMEAELEQIQDEIYQFLALANPILVEEGQVPFHFGGSFITGNLKNPNYLFLGINPGFGVNRRIGETWEKGVTKVSPPVFCPKEVKYIDEFNESLPLANKVVEIILGGEVEKLGACAETSFISFFATPSVKELNVQLNALPIELKQFHNNLMIRYRELILKNINPKNIVCIGFTTLHEFMKVLGIKHSQVKMEYIDTGDINNTPVYYKSFELNGSPVHGVLHLSGARLSSEMVENLKTIFSKLN